ncbi:MAG: TonB-dependent receptor [Sphingobium sp.]
MRGIGAALCLGMGAWVMPAEAQRTEENASREAEDGFGKSVGSESIGIYASGEVRGFSATAAGNNRIEGVYFDRQASVTNTIVRGSTVRLGMTAFGYPFPAPTGIVDLDLRRAGKKPVVSVQLNSGDYLGTDFVVDAALPVTERLGVNLDLGLYDDEYVYGGGGWFVSYGGVARWRPVDAVEMTGFFGRYDFGDEEQEPVIYTNGNILPPEVERRRYLSQGWADWRGHSQALGGIVKADLGAWQVAGGVFNSRFTRDDYASPYFTGVGRDGAARSYVVLGNDQRAASTSGEIRLSRAFAEGVRRHRLLVALRGRAVDTDYGGFSLIDLGPARLEVPVPIAKPPFPSAPLTRDEVRQTSYAIGYEMRWPGIVEINLGLTRSDYRKSVAQPGLPVTEDRDNPWLWNAAFAVTPTKRFTLYAAATRGLEENGIAPANAVNRFAALPALRTRQYEFGFSYAFPGSWNLVAAAFDISKPYFEIDRTDGMFRQLGDVVHRGIEASLSGRPLTGLSIVAGAVVLRPRVSGQAVEDGRLGERPIGRTGLLVDVTADYRIPALPGFSIDTHVTHEGRRVANAASTLELPARTIVNLGARYRMKVGRVPTMLRLQVKNITDTFGWKVSSGGGFTLMPGRRVALSLTADI